MGIRKVGEKATKRAIATIAQRTVQLAAERDEVFNQLVKLLWELKQTGIPIEGMNEDPSEGNPFRVSIGKVVLVRNTYGARLLYEWREDEFETPQEFDAWARREGAFADNLASELARLIQESTSGESHQAIIPAIRAALTQPEA